MGSLFLCQRLYYFAKLKEILGKHRYLVYTHNCQSPRWGGVWGWEWGCSLSGKLGELVLSEVLPSPGWVEWGLL